MIKVYRPRYTFLHKERPGYDTFIFHKGRRGGDEVGGRTDEDAALFPFSHVIVF